MSHFLPKAFVDEQFAFYGGMLTGTPQLRRDGSAPSMRPVTPSARRPAKCMCNTTSRPRRESAGGGDGARPSFRLQLAHRSPEWMSPATKLKAKAKLATLKVAVGYPDNWRDYSGLQVVRGDALGNFERAELFEYHRNLAKLGTPVDRNEWVMTPQTVNAVNLPVMNAINIPAAMLQPPFFDPHRPMVMDYGAVGSTIGHEISHSFDDQGAQFDASGQLQNWWTPQDLAHFEASAAQLAAQFDAYQPFPDAHVNGKQTLSENVADVAGLAAAYDAYRLAAPDRPRAGASGNSPTTSCFI